MSLLLGTLNVGMASAQSTLLHMYRSKVKKVFVFLHFLKSRVGKSVKQVVNFELPNCTHTQKKNHQAIVQRERLDNLSRATRKTDQQPQCSGATELNSKWGPPAQPRTHPSQLQVLGFPSSKRIVLSPLEANRQVDFSKNRAELNTLEVKSNPK